ncbi:DWNN domain-containing protein [Blyttiomyces helicus]|uniref:DWNN domain-containing protein n=1 Tax=Blyttiomyces helicus TaxID=388810 RepID=A0A4P9W775_9FUNG|nr:DWNN domain-containing protein [Blyttiomyces helicus]|eukprot:RKO86610.1 DWNN domain-containing protein [Blyttiomyces helicus]
MAVGWVVAAPLAIVVARYGKAALGVWWFRIHVVLMVGGATVGTYVGFGMVYTAIEWVGSPHFEVTADAHGAHVVLGLLVLTLIAPQAILGFVIDRLWTPTRVSIPWWDRLHWWVGRIVVLVTVINIPLGINTYGGAGSWAYIVYGLWLGLVVVSFVSLQGRVGQVHHVEDGFEGMKAVAPRRALAAGLRTRGLCRPRRLKTAARHLSSSRPCSNSLPPSRKQKYLLPPLPSRTLGKLPLCPLTMSVVFYKFRSAKDYDTITFDGNGISVFDLKREIMVAKKLGKGTDFDLAIYNAQTNDDPIELPTPNPTHVTPSGTSNRICTSSVELSRDPYTQNGSATPAEKHSPSAWTEEAAARSGRRSERRSMRTNMGVVVFG